jgi:hypothetical protein
MAIRHDPDLVLVLAKALAQYHYCLDWDMVGFDKDAILREAYVILDTLAEVGIEIPEALVDDGSSDG